MAAATAWRDWETLVASSHIASDAASIGASFLQHVQAATEQLEACQALLDSHTAATLPGFSNAIATDYNASGSEGPAVSSDAMPPPPPKDKFTAQAKAGRKRVRSSGGDDITPAAPVSNAGDGGGGATSDGAWAWDRKRPRAGLGYTYTAAESRTSGITSPAQLAAADDSNDEAATHKDDEMNGAAPSHGLSSHLSGLGAILGNSGVAGMLAATDEDLSADGASGKNGKAKRKAKGGKKSKASSEEAGANAAQEAPAAPAAPANPYLDSSSSSSAADGRGPHAHAHAIHKKERLQAAATTGGAEKVAIPLPALLARRHPEAAARSAHLASASTSASVGGFDPLAVFLTHLPAVSTQPSSGTEDEAVSAALEAAAGAKPSYFKRGVKNNMPADYGKTRTQCQLSLYAIATYIYFCRLGAI